MANFSSRSNPKKRCKSDGEDFQVRIHVHKKLHSFVNALYYLFGNDPELQPEL